MGNFVRISVQLQAHQNKLLPCAAAGAETARIAAILGETNVLIQHSCGGILGHDVQFQLGIPCRFGALNTGLRQGAADAPAPIGPVDTDAELGAVAQLTGDFTAEELVDAMRHKFGPSKEHMMPKNREAIERGMAAAKG